MAKKRVKIDQSLCIGCGACVGTYPEDITLDENGLAKVINEVADEDAVNVCPAGAISVEE